MRRVLPWVLLIAGSVGLAGGGLLLSASRAVPPLPVLGQAPAFSLIDHAGRPFSNRELQGCVWVADFVFTRCSGQCPMMHERMRTVAQTIAHPDVRLVSFTVDPEWDTPQVLASYVQQQGWSSQRWSFVTGDRAELARVCQEGFHLSMGDEEPGAAPVTHSVRLVVVDRRGNIRGYYDATDDTQMARLTRDLRQLASAP